MADLTFGESMNLLATQEYNAWISGVFDQIFYVSVSRAFQYFPLLWRFIQWSMPKSVRDAADGSLKHSADRVDKRLAMDTERPDVFGLVLKHETGSKMSRHEMHANADFLMIAGTDTAATQVSGLTYNLLSNPSCMRHLTREIRESFASSSDITVDALARLPVSFLRAISSLVTNLHITVSVSLSRRRPKNILDCRRGRTPQDQRTNRHNDLRSLGPAKRE